MDEHFTGDRVAAGEDGVELFGLDLAFEAEELGRVARPSAWCFAEGVVVLDAVGDGLQVVVAVADLGDAQHHDHPVSR